jgi:hypothetical protein
VCRCSHRPVSAALPVRSGWRRVLLAERLAPNGLERPEAVAVSPTPGLRAALVTPQSCRTDTTPAIRGQIRGGAAAETNVESPQREEQREKGGPAAGRQRGGRTTGPIAITHAAAVALGEATKRHSPPVTSPNQQTRDRASLFRALLCEPPASAWRFVCWIRPCHRSGSADFAHSRTGGRGL